MVQAIRKYIAAVIVMILASSAMLAQTGMLIVSGTIKDDGSGRKLPGAVVTVFQDDVVFKTSEVDKNAKYNFELPLGFTYTFEYERDGFTGKKVELDVSHTPNDESVDGFGFDLDMALFKNIDGFDTSILDEPMGIGAYNPDTRKFSFDLDHTDRMKMRIENEMNRLAAIEENAAKNKRAFDIAMKEGEDFMKKKKWQDALNSFNTALDLIPEEPEAVELRDKARAKLDEIAAKEAEKLAEEEAKRAEEEAEAAAKAAEEAARQAEADAKRAEAEARKLKAQQEREARMNDLNGGGTDADSNNAVVETRPEREFDQSLIEDTSDEDAARLAQEEADNRARMQAMEDAAAADAEKKREEEEEAARRAALLANSSSSSDTDADNFFKEALKSERQARAAEIEERKESEEERLRQRGYEAEDRKSDRQQELDDLVAKSEEDKLEGDRRSRRNAEKRAQMYSFDADFRTQRVSRADRKRANNAEEVERTKEYNSDWDHSVEKTVEEEYKGRAKEHQEEIEYTQDVIDSRTKKQDGYLDSRRIERRSGAWEESYNRHEAYAGDDERQAGDPMLSPADEDLPQGFHEYSYEIPNGTVIELTYRDGDQIVRYKKVLMRTGTFYFRNGQSITASIFHRETTVIHD